MKLKEWQVYLLIFSGVVFLMSVVAFIWGDDIEKNLKPEPLPSKQELAHKDSVRKSLRERNQARIKKYGEVADFKEANQGDYWIINSENIAVVNRPELAGNEQQLRRILVTLIKPGEKVEILATKFPYWKKVNVYGLNGRKYATGWLLGDSVEKARITEKGALTLR